MAEQATEDFDITLLDLPASTEGTTEEPPAPADRGPAEASVGPTEPPVSAEPGGGLVTSPTEPITPAEAPPVVSETPEFDYSTPLNARERALVERLERITGERLDLSRPSSTEGAEPTFTPQEHNFLEGLDMDELLATPENFNRLLLSVYNRGLEAASRLAAENVMRTLPATVSNFVGQQLTTERLVADFYAKNPDLSEVKRTVAAVANEISASHPEYTLQQVFDAAAKGTRELLKIKETTPQPQPQAAPTKGQVVRQARGLTGHQGGSSTRFSAPELDGLAKEVNDLIMGA